MKLHLISLGCVKNLIDSEVMLGKLQNYELTNEIEEADVIIVNTCGFINSAKEESIDTILEAHSLRKENSTLIMAGCMSERYQNELKGELPEVDIFTGVGDYDKIDKIIENKKSTFSDKTFLIKNEKRVITGSSYHAYIKLSEGCNQKCSFCAIPGFKGKLQSRSIEEIVEEVKTLKEAGYRDFSFASQDSSSYLRDFKIRDGLEQLIDEIDKIDDITARILYLYPTTTTKRLIKKIHNSKVFENYFDMPIQHSTEKMLKVMRRESSVDKLNSLLEYMKEKPSFVRTSVIVGHPSESDEDFESMKEFVKNYKFDRVNIFEYSDEENTHAYNSKEKIDAKTISKRAKEMGKIVKKTTKENLKNYINQKIKCYLDGLTDDELFYSARPSLWTPEVDGDILINDSEVENLEVGEKYSVLVESLAGDQLIGKIICK